MTSEAAVYLAFAVCGVFLNSVVIIAIVMDKEMKNPTYKFITSLAVCDNLALFNAVCLPIVDAIWTERQYVPWQIIAFITYVGAVGAHCGQLMLSLVAFSRCIHFAMKHQNEILFSCRRLGAILIVCYVLILSLYLLFVTDREAVIALPYGGYSTVNSSYGILIPSFTNVISFASGLLQVVFNVMSFIWILKLRYQIVTPEMRKIHAQEVRLFVQCAIDFLVYIASISFGEICNNRGCAGASLSVFIALSLLNFIDCALLYLCFNRKLRSTILAFILKVALVLCRKVKVTPNHLSTNMIVTPLPAVSATS